MQHTKSYSKEINEFTRKRIGKLQTAYLMDASNARATMAQLRRTVGKPLSSAVDAWDAVFVDMPEHLKGRSDEPNRAEEAIYAALGLYAMHQQSKQEKMHQPSHHGTNAWNGLGSAVRKVAASGENSSAGITRRFKALAKATEFDAYLYHLRGLVHILRAHSIPLDYGELASDLYNLQFPDRKQRVQLNWARQYSLVMPKAEDTESSTENHI